MSEAMQALYAGDTDRAKALLPPDQELSVFEAAAFGRVERLRAVLDADPSRARAFSDDGFTALHLAVFAAEEATARILIERGAGLDTVSTSAITQVPPIGTAAFVGSVPLARLLLDAGADAGSVFATIPTTTLADLLGREQVMDTGIRPLWPAPRVAGRAFTVRCPPGDNLMLHAAIHRALRGAVIVVESGDLDFALAGGNVCAVAQRRGIAAFVLDGLIRDLAEVRELGFAVFARGVIPIPGRKEAVEPLNSPVRCGGVKVDAGDMVVADEDGVVVVPGAHQAQVLVDARAKQAMEAAESLDDWEAAHRERIDEILGADGFEA
jgi:4-hydroxy-4-methyl-2-oxoglutarate aldolase